MITDVKAAVDRLKHLDVADPNRIYLCGVDIGGGVALLSAALNKDVAGVASLNGFTPWRKATASSGVPGLRAWSHDFGLWPQLGTFVGREAQLPFDWDDVLAALAPRPVLVATGKFSQDAIPAHIEETASNLSASLKATDQANHIQFTFINDFNRFSYPVYRALGDATLIDWFRRLNRIEP
jgi:pimeloyl-ACP methyl ester carboxylesterase